MVLIVDIKVVPSAGVNKWVLDKNGIIKCYLKSPPEKGLANKELVKLLAQAIKIPQQDVHLIGGLSSRKKTIKIMSSLSSVQQLLAVLGLEIVEQQKKLF